MVSARHALMVNFLDDGFGKNEADHIAFCEVDPALGGAR